MMEHESQVYPVYADLNQVEKQSFVVEFEAHQLTCSYDDNRRVWLPKHDIERIFLGQPVTQSPTIMDARTRLMQDENLKSKEIDGAQGCVDLIRCVLREIENACLVETNILTQCTST
jgi:hypothetical protein